MANPIEKIDILFAAGDVGGARAMLPVIQQCESEGFSFAILKNGHINHEAPAHWKRICLQGSDDTNLLGLLQSSKPDLVVFTSSVKDDIPLRLARQTRTLFIPTIHLLDAWSGYRRRMETDCLPMFIPDIYTVPDSRALRDAVLDGIPGNILRVIGQPGMSSLLHEFEQYGNNRILPESISKRKHIIFVSEPVTMDQGSNPASPGFRGYTEETVLRLFCRALQPVADTLHIGLLPHPRENKKHLVEMWDSFHGKLKGGILDAPSGRHAVFQAHGIAGMASILLYEAWLIGKPVISIQPDLKLNALNVPAERKGITFVKERSSIRDALLKWVDNVRPSAITCINKEIDRHRDAPANCVSLIKQFIGSYPITELKENAI